VISEPRPEFWVLYGKLPAEVRAVARKNYGLFMQDPRHPSLHFKLLNGYADVWSVRVGPKHRAVGVKSDDVIQWFRIGSHSEFDRLF